MSSVTREIMEAQTNMMLHTAIYNLTQHGALAEAVLSLGPDGAPYIAVNSGGPWYKSPETVTELIRENAAVAAVFVTPAYALFGNEAVGEVVLIHALCPEIGYRRTELVDVENDGSTIRCTSRPQERVDIPETHIGWLERALSA